MKSMAAANVSPSPRLTAMSSTLVAVVAIRSRIWVPWNWGQSCNVWLAFDGKTLRPTEGRAVANAAWPRQRTLSCLWFWKSIFGKVDGADRSFKIHPANTYRAQWYSRNTTSAISLMIGPLPIRSWISFVVKTIQFRHQSHTSELPAKKRKLVYLATSSYQERSQAPETSSSASVSQ